MINIQPFFKIINGDKLNACIDCHHYDTFFHFDYGESHTIMCPNCENITDTHSTIGDAINEWNSMVDDGMRPNRKLVNDFIQAIDNKINDIIEILDCIDISKRRYLITLLHYGKDYHYLKDLISRYHDYAEHGDNYNRLMAKLKIEDLIDERKDSNCPILFDDDLKTIFNKK